MSGIVPMEVDKPQLLNTIPRDAPKDKIDWTAQQEQEYLRRVGEMDSIKARDLKIETHEKKVAKLKQDRDNEVERINRRRDIYDDKIEGKNKREETGRSVRKRKREEAEEKEEMIIKHKNRGRNPQ